MTAPSPMPLRRKATIAVSAALATIFAIAALTVLHDRYVDTRPSFSQHYTLSVNLSSDTDHTVICPMPVLNNGSIPEEFLSEVEVVDGSAILAIANTSHGLALEIRGRGDIRVEWTDHHRASTGPSAPNMTMTTNSDIDLNTQTNAWVYTDDPDVKLHLDYSSVYRYYPSPHWVSGGGPFYSLKIQSASLGWKEYPLDHSNMIIN